MLKGRVPDGMRNAYTILQTYGVTKNNPSGNFLTIYWIQTQYILLLGEQVLTIFLCIKRVRLNWSFIVNDVQSATYSVTGPLVLQEIFPIAKHESESTYISMDNTWISEKTFSVPLGFGDTFLPLIYWGPYTYEYMHYWCSWQIFERSSENTKKMRWLAFAPILMTDVHPM